MRTFLCLVAICASIAGRAQTSPEIYNYITQGYITTIKQGMDFKKGYAFTEIIKGSPFNGSLSNSHYQFSYRSFHAENDKSHAVAFMIVLLKDDKVDKVFCLPSATSDAELYRNFYTDVSARLYADQKEVMYRELAMLYTVVFKAAEIKSK